MSAKLLTEMPRYGHFSPHHRRHCPGDVEMTQLTNLTVHLNRAWPERSDCEQLLKKYRYVTIDDTFTDARQILAEFSNYKQPDDEMLKMDIDGFHFYVLANPKEKVELARLAVSSAIGESGPLYRYLAEEMSFRQLMNYSDPKRVVRSLTVHGPPLNIRAFEDSMYYLFNFKSSPSTTGMRHKGYIKFLKPDKRKALMDVKCLVDCTCQDFRYRWAWADKQRRASKVGPNSMNQALNRAPHITNPTGRPGMCKHLLALRNWIDNSLDVLTSDSADDGSALSRLVAYAQQRKDNEKDVMAAAKNREYDKVLAMLRKRRGEPGPLDRAAGKTPDEPEEGDETPDETTVDGIKQETPTPGTEPPLVSPYNSPNPLDFHGRIPDTEGEPEDEPDPHGKLGGKGPKRTVDSLEPNTNMNLIEAQLLVKEMMDASPVAQNQLGTGTSANVQTAPNQTPQVPGGEGGDVSAESEALNLLRNINAGIQELVPAIQQLSQGGAGLQGPGDMDGIEFPEPGGEGGEGGEGEGLDIGGSGEGADRFDQGGEDSGGEFGDRDGGEAFGGSASREREGGSAGREGGSAGREGSASREREGRRGKMSIPGKGKGGKGKEE